MTMIEVISTRFPTSVPISQAVRAGDIIFVSGQVPLDPVSNELVQGSIEDQTKVVLERIGGILKDAGCTLDDVVKTTVFLANIADFPAMNQVYARYFPTGLPARSCIATKLAVDAGIEIEAIAYAPRNQAS